MNQKNDNKQLQPYMNDSGKLLEVVPVTNTIGKITNTQSRVFDVATEIFDNLKINYNAYEPKLLKSNSFELFEFIYSIVKSTIIQLQRVETDSLEDLLQFNFNTMVMFVEPIDVTKEENEWADTLLARKSEESGTDLALRVEPEAERYFFINLKRIIEENEGNPKFSLDRLDEILK